MDQPTIIPEVIPPEEVKGSEYRPFSPSGRPTQPVAPPPNLSQGLFRLIRGVAGLALFAVGLSLAVIFGGVLFLIIGIAAIAFYAYFRFLMWRAGKGGGISKTVIVQTSAPGETTRRTIHIQRMGDQDDGPAGRGRSL